MPKLKEACIGITNEELKKQLEAVEKEMEELEGKLAKFKGAGTKLVTEKELN